MAAANESRPGTQTPPPAGSVEQALEWILRSVRRLPVEVVPLSAAAGRVLADDVLAPGDLWPFARAAMDGYAVRAADPTNPVPGLRRRRRPVRWSRRWNGFCGPSGACRSR